MRILLKCLKWGIILLTALFVCYFATFIFDEDLASILNDQYDMYVYIQILHIFVSLSVLFVLWSNNLFDKWQKMDQTMIVLFFSIIGLWIWFALYYNKYVIYQEQKSEE